MINPNGKEKTKPKQSTGLNFNPENRISGHQTYLFKIHTFKYNSLYNGTFLNMLIGYFNVYEYIVNLVDLKGEKINPWD